MAFDQGAYASSNLADKLKEYRKAPSKEPIRGRGYKKRMQDFSDVEKLCIKLDKATPITLNGSKYDMEAVGKFTNKAYKDKIDSWLIIHFKFWKEKDYEEILLRNSRFKLSLHTEKEKFHAAESEEDLVSMVTSHPYVRNRVDDLKYQFWKNVEEDANSERTKEDEIRIVWTRHISDEPITSGVGARLMEMETLFTRRNLLCAWVEGRKIEQGFRVYKDAEGVPEEERIKTLAKEARKLLPYFQKSNSRT